MEKTLIERLLPFSNTSIRLGQINQILDNKVEKKIPKKIFINDPNSSTKPNWQNSSKKPTNIHDQKKQQMF